MKRPSEYLRIRLIRLSRYSATRRLNRTSKTKAKSNVYVSPREVIKAPSRFCLTKGLGIEVVKFLKAVANRVLVIGKPVRLNFKDTEAFYVPGAIFLFAELDRIISLSNLPKPITIIDPYRRRPREVLKQIQIHQLTGDKSEIVPTRDDVVFWKATKGSDQSGDDLGPILEFVTERSNEKHIKQVEVSGIWRGVSEAVANVVDHAYENPRADGFQGLDETKWWMFTQIREQRFTAAVCDLGCGYKSTINQNIPESFIALFKDLFRLQNKDAAAIKVAMEYGRSGTKQDNRGKGSRDALSVLTMHGQGELTVLSNSGLVQFSLNGGHEDVTMDDIGIDIGGTVIWWRLPLVENGNDQD
jgi:hypothetical protein